LFIPVIFAGKLLDKKLLLMQFLSFIAFSAVCSGVYLFNDICDRKMDAQHPRKCNRPFAGNKIPVSCGYLLSLSLMGIGVYLSTCLCLPYNYKALFFILLYIQLNIAYSIYLKNIPIIDIALLSSFYVLRLLYGAAFINIPVSHLLLLTVMSGAVCISLSKRRSEFKIGENCRTRKVLRKYNYSFLTYNTYMFMTLTIFFYVLWCISKDENKNALFLWSVPAVLFIFVRYSFLIETDKTDRNPVDIVLGDVPLLLSSTFLGIYALCLMYF
jgi:4-hydroxybenzoate polyprenyltransferase